MVDRKELTTHSTFLGNLGSEERDMPVVYVGPQ
jgi:hypothetical protein